MREPKDIEINGKRLDVILEEHMHWLNKDIDGWENMRADLSDIALHDADLSSIVLRNANLSGIVLRFNTLRCIDLRGADLYGAILHTTDLYCADLRGADLRYVDLTNANLYGANLRGADLRYVDLINANLCGANLKGADLRCTDLRGANLYDVKLNGANGDLIQYRKGKILTESIIGYKKCKHDIIVTLEIPRGAIVFSINGNKCRTNKARVIAIDRADRAYSINNNTSYYIGDEFTIYNFDCEYNKECASGIHFFMTKEKAIEYEY